MQYVHTEYGFNTAICMSKTHLRLNTKKASSTTKCLEAFLYLHELQRHTLRARG